MNNFAIRLEGLMKPMTQQQVADACDVSQPTVQRWLKGTIPGGEELLKLANFLGVDPYTLMYEDRPMPPMLLREVPSEALVDEAIRELDDLKEKVQSLDRAMKRLKQKSVVSSKVTYDAKRGALKAAASAKTDPSE